jgi:UrcA family protein
MSKCLSTTRLALISGAALGFACLAAPASAQDYPPPPPNGGPGYQSSEEVIITAPRRYRTPAQPSITGAPITTAEMTRAVRYDDLDLQSPYGRRILHDRISRAARAMCDRLDAMYPAVVTDTVSMPASSSCYEDAMQDASYQADAVIRNSTGPNGPSW